MDGHKYNLKKSKDYIGPLYPILLDAKGRIIDGIHREEADKNWSKITLSHIQTDKDFLVARIVANICRRNVSIEERRLQLTELAEILLSEGVKPGKISREISRLTGLKESWICELLPKRFKRAYPREVLHVESPPTVDIQEDVKTILEELEVTRFPCPFCEKELVIIHLDPTGEHKIESLE